MLSRLKWLTFLSLDAPLVAIAWQAIFAKAGNVDLGWHHFSIIFMSVWLGYAADRWFDNFKNVRPASQQHHFYARNSGPIAIVWILVLFASVSLAFATLTAGELTHGFILMAASVAYTLFAQRARHLEAYPILKSLFTALLVLASALLFIPWASLSLIETLSIWLLFTSNCLFIRAWTHINKNKTARQAGQMALANVLFSTWAIGAQQSPIATASLIAQAGILLLHFLNEESPPQAAACLNVAEANRSNPQREGRRNDGRKTFGPQTCRTVADLCLLSPFAVLLF